MTAEDSIDLLSQALVGELVDAGRTLATAESCSGGWIAKALTDVPGSSAAFGWGIVSYSNEAKMALLGVGAATLERHGAVSEQTALEMAAGALERSGADFALAVSGIAGPDGGTADKPVGTVWFAWAVRRDGGPSADALCRHFAGDRRAVREQTVITALQGLRERLREGCADG